MVLEDHNNLPMYTSFMNYRFILSFIMANSENLNLTRMAVTFTHPLKGYQ